MYAAECLLWRPWPPLDHSQDVLGPCGHHGLQSRGQAGKGGTGSGCGPREPEGFLQPFSVAAHRSLRPPAHGAAIVTPTAYGPGRPDCSAAEWSLPGPGRAVASPGCPQWAEHRGRPLQVPEPRVSRSGAHPCPRPARPVQPPPPFPTHVPASLGALVSRSPPLAFQKRLLPTC